MIHPSHLPSVLLPLGDNSTQGQPQGCAQAVLEGRTPLTWTKSMARVELINLNDCWYSRIRRCTPELFGSLLQRVFSPMYLQHWGLGRCSGPGVIHSKPSPLQSGEPQKGSVSKLAGTLCSLKFGFISQGMQALQLLPSHVVLFMHGWENSVDELCCLRPDFRSWPS